MLNLNTYYILCNLVDNEHIETKVEIFNIAPTSYRNTTNPQEEILNTWEVQSGTVKIRIAEERDAYHYSYVVDVVIEDAVYLDTSGNTIEIKEKYFDNRVVG